MLILGLVRDEEELQSDRMKLWDEFNTCWLAVLQKQKDVTQQYADAGQQAQNVISKAFLRKMGDDLIRLCDRMEQHGLVDYEMGVWEEEILSGWSPHCGETHYCTKLIFSSPDSMHRPAGKRLGDR